MIETNIICADIFEGLNQVPDNTIDLILTDPPYGIKKADWDKFEAGKYEDFTTRWIVEACKKLRSTGQLYVWHNSIHAISSLIQTVEQNTNLNFNSFCIWHKPHFRHVSWATPNNNNRSWFNVCEYCVLFAPSEKDKTGMDKILSNPDCFGSLKNWYKNELARLGKTENDLIEFYKKITGKKGYIFRHYFKDSQFQIPSEEIYNRVFTPFGFIRESESLRQEYESLRYYHKTDSKHSNVFYADSQKRISTHPCEKPVNILRRFIEASCKPGGTVLDPFCGSGTTGLAAVQLDRNFIGIDKDKRWHNFTVNLLQDEIKKWYHNLPQS